MKTGLFGGTFNPIHNGHLNIAKHALSLLKLDRIFFIPTGLAPHKPQRNIASKSHRKKMIALAIKDQPFFTLCDIEIKSPRVSYTLDTVSDLKRLYPKDDFFFIIGTDAFSKISEWKESSGLLALCPFVVFPRVGTPFSRLPTLPAKQEHILYMPVAPMRISSSQIRTRIKEEKKVDTLLPKVVLSYIIKNSLYAENDP